MDKNNLAKLKNILDIVYSTENDKFLNSDMNLSDTSSCLKVLHQLKIGCDNVEISSSISEIENMVKELYHKDLINKKKEQRSMNFKQSIEIGKYHDEIRRKR